MSVSVVIITHEEVGAAMLQAATNTLGGELPLPCTIVTVDVDTNPDELLPKLKNIIGKFSPKEGLLILTDVFGSTPSNIAHALAEVSNVRIVSGLNMPMLLRVMNYPSLSLDELARKASTGGREGVIES